MKLLDPQTIGEVLGIHRSTVDRLMRLPVEHPDRLRSIRFGQGKRKATWRVREEWLVEWVDRHEEKATTRQMPRPRLRVADANSAHTFSQGFPAEDMKNGTD